MSLLSYIDQSYIRIFDAIFSRLHQPTPAADVLDRCKIISHRGEHDGEEVKENSITAFDRAAEAGVWGIELDVRWTSDLVPVVAHDPDLNRVHDIDAPIAGISWPLLQRMTPDVPTLAQVVDRFGGRVHLMIEIKHLNWPAPDQQSSILRDVLSPLKPEVDYHIMALRLASLTRISGFPAESMVAIANYQPSKYSRWVADKRWGGLCAHYGMMRKALIEKHHNYGQKVGTAYPKSRNCLFRELNRGVDWIFSNDAVFLMDIINEEKNILARPTQ